MRNTVFAVKSVFRRLAIGRVRFTTAAGTNPSAVSDPFELVASVTRTGNGAYTVTLEQSYAHVLPLSARIVSATVDSDIKFTTIGEGATGTASTILLQAYTPSTGAALDLNTIVVEVLFGVAETEDDP